MSRRDCIDVAMGRTPADLAIINGRLVNVITAEIYDAGVAVKGDRIAAVGDINYTIGPNTQVIDAKGQYITPGLIETHYHMYESYLTSTQLARAVLPCGTTSMPEAFYGIGIVGGTKAVKFFYDELLNTPCRLLFQVPILAYLQNDELGIPKTKCAPTIEDLHDMLDWEACVGLEEPPAIPIYEKDPEMLGLFEAVLARKKAITGHGTQLRGRELQAYVIMGAASDHETVLVDEAIEKVRLGLSISVREGTQMTDLRTLIKCLTEHKMDARYFNMCNDIAAPRKLATEGNLDQNIRLAISCGVNPITAIQMATLNAAELLRVDQDLGAITPGRFADILLVSDLPSFNVTMTIAGGKVVAKDGKMVVDVVPPKYPQWMYETVKLTRKVTADDFIVRADGKTATVRTIHSMEGCIISPEKHYELAVKDGEVQPDIEKDVLKIFMVDRFLSGGGIGVGFVDGFKLKRGAIASTYNPVCENILGVGTNDADIALAVNELAAQHGGFIAVADGKVLCRVELPLLGLLSDEPFETVVEKMNKMNKTVQDLGCEYQDPFSTLAFLGVCGETGILKISDTGLYDLSKRSHVSTIV